MTDIPEMKACPFCGMSVDLEDDDVLHPSAVCWRDEDFGDGSSIRTYHSHRNRREGDERCWEINCPTPAGGCGAHITADSREEVIAKWNRRDGAASDREMSDKMLEALRLTEMHVMDEFIAAGIGALIKEVEASRKDEQ